MLNDYFISFKFKYIHFSLSLFNFFSTNIQTYTHIRILYRLREATVSVLTHGKLVFKNPSDDVGIQQLDKALATISQAIKVIVYEVKRLSSTDAKTTPIPLPAGVSSPQPTPPSASDQEKIAKLIEEKKKREPSVSHPNIPPEVQKIVQSTEKALTQPTPTPAPTATPTKSVTISTPSTPAPTTTTSTTTTSTNTPPKEGTSNNNEEPRSGRQGRTLKTRRSFVMTGRSLGKV